MTRRSGTVLTERPEGWVYEGAPLDEESYPRPGVELRLLGRHAPLGGREVLEIGCGYGRLTFQYAPLARRVVALDPSRDAIAWTRREARRRGHDHVRFLERPAQDGFGGLGGFDVAIFSWSL